MKKTIILLSILFILVSCGKNEIKEKNIEKQTVQEIKTNTGIDLQTKANTGTIQNQTGTIINTGSQEPKKEEIIKTIKKEGFNLFLYKNDQKIDSLTTYGNAENVDYTNCNGDKTKKLVAYNILSSDEKYSFIEKSIYNCNGLGGEEGLNYFILSFLDQKPEYYKLSDYSLPKVNDFSPEILINNDFDKKYSFVISGADGETYGEEALKKLGYKKDGEGVYSSYIKIINFDEEYNKAKELVNKEIKKQEVRKQNGNKPIIGDYKHQEKGRNYTIITISNLKDNSFDFKYMTNGEAEIEDNDKSFGGFGIGKKEGNNWKLYINIDDANDMSNCTAKIEFLPEGISIKDKKDCEFYMMEGIYK